MSVLYVTEQRSIIRKTSDRVVEEYVKNGASLLSESADGQWTALLLHRGA